MTQRLCGLLLLALAIVPVNALAAEKVTTLRVPDGGIAPQAEVDADGAVHLVYFKRTEGHLGDLYYVRSGDGGATFSKPLRVNSQPNSAISVRHPRVALGRNGRVHVVWNGSNVAKPKGPSNPALPADSPYNGTPLLYARLAEDGKSFEPQRNLMTKTFALDGGGAVAADGKGNVYAVWHAGHEDLPEGEPGRRVWVARSTDDGATFAPEEMAWDQPTGACGCCHVRAWAGGTGTVHVLFRGAKTGIQRDTYLLTSTDAGKSFSGADVHPWRVSTCPMSTYALRATPRGVVAAWETEGQVYFGNIDSAGKPVAQLQPAPGEAKDRKMPDLATNRRGETLRVWTEGMAWKRGGAVAWQLHDRDGRPTDVKGKADGVLPDGAAAVFPRKDGSFVIIY